MGNRQILKTGLNYVHNVCNKSDINTNIIK